MKIIVLASGSKGNATYIPRLGECSVCCPKFNTQSPSDYTSEQRHFSMSPPLNFLGHFNSHIEPGNSTCPIYQKNILDYYYYYLLRKCAQSQKSVHHSTTES